MSFQAWTFFVSLFPEYGKMNEYEKRYDLMLLSDSFRCL